MSRALSRLLLLCSSLCLCPHAFAAPRAPVASTRAAQVAQLQSWAQAGQIEAPSPLNLDVRAADLEAARATKPLQEWVRRGGVIVLHTDAASAFGFQTVGARERTFERAGQRWGKSENALPFGGSPLLLGGRSASRIGQTDGVPGVRTVFYQLDSGDALIQNVGTAGVPLLRVQDNTAPTKNVVEPTLYAAAMRRYGAGWALFVPRTIEARADGARFQSNLDAFIAAANESKWLSLPVSAVQAAFVPASQKQSVDWQSLREALRPAMDEKKLPIVSDEAQVVLSLDDAKALDAVWEQADATSNDSALQERGRALVYLLSARALWQKDSDEGAPLADARLAALWDTSSAARQTLWQTQQGGPAAAMTRWWCGVLALGAALPPIPTQYQPQLIAFSYAQPAQEAAQWWQNVTIDEALKPMVAAAAQAANQMALQHKDDPPLLAYWRTENGTRYWMQLAPIQAASDKFPPLPQDWGMPQQTIGYARTHTSLYLVPVGSDNAMPLEIVAHPLAYPEGNSLRPQMYWRCSSLWSGILPKNWGLQQENSFVLLSPQLIDFYTTPLETRVETWVITNQEFTRGQKIFSRYFLQYPIPSWEAYRKQNRVRPPSKKPLTEADYYKDYGGVENMNFAGQEAMAYSMPARVARLHAHLLATFWQDSTIPQWMDDGLQNVFSLGMGEIINRNSADLKVIAPFPKNQARLILSPRARLASKMMPYALRESWVSSNPELEPVADSKSEFIGQPLAKLDSTHRVSYFYQKYGAGAFVETLQRLGSGQNIDAALQATTGLTQQQFLAAADAN